MVLQSFFFIFNVLALMDGDDNEGGAAASLALIFLSRDCPNAPDAAAAAALQCHPVDKVCTSISVGNCCAVPLRRSVYHLSLQTSVLNKHLSSLMPGLTAKVFRTYNASITLQQQLKILTNSKTTHTSLSRGAATWTSISPMAYTQHICLTRTGSRHGGLLSVCRHRTFAAAITASLIFFLLQLLVLKHPIALIFRTGQMHI